MGSDDDSHVAAFHRVGRPGLDRLMIVTTFIAERAEARGNRYFGNVSTRCMNTFPSMKLLNESGVRAWVSPSSTDKRRICSDDMILVEQSVESSVLYSSDRKPSVDSAVHLEIYARTPVNFMVHGHAYSEHDPFTETYFPCGDMRGVDELVPLIEHFDGDGIVNLMHHGFLLFGKTIESVEHLSDTTVFKIVDDERV